MGDSPSLSTRETNLIRHFRTETQRLVHILQNARVALDVEAELDLIRKRRGLVPDKGEKNERRREGVGVWPGVGGRESRIAKAIMRKHERLTYRHPSPTRYSPRRSSTPHSASPSTKASRPPPPLPVSSFPYPSIIQPAMKSSPAPSRSSPTKAQPERSRSLSPQKSSMKQPFRAASAPIPNVGAKMKRSERVPPPLPERKRVASPEKVARLAQEEFIKRQEASRQALSHPDIYYDALSEFRKLYPTFFSRDDYAGGVLTPPPHDPEYQSGGQASNPFEDGRWRRARRAGTQSPTLAEEMRMKKQSDGGSYWSGGFSVTPRLTMKRDAWVGDDNDDERLQVSVPHAVITKVSAPIPGQEARPQLPQRSPLPKNIKSLQAKQARLAASLREKGAAAAISTARPSSARSVVTPHKWSPSRKYATPPAGREPIASPPLAPPVPQARSRSKAKDLEGPHPWLDEMFASQVSKDRRRRCGPMGVAGDTMDLNKFVVRNMTPYG